MTAVEVERDVMTGVEQFGDVPGVGEVRPAIGANPAHLLEEGAGRRAHDP